MSKIKDNSPTWVEPDEGSIRHLQWRYYEFKYKGHPYAGYAKMEIKSFGDLTQGKYVYYITIRDPENGDRKLNVTVQKKTVDLLTMLSHRKPDKSLTRLYQIIDLRKRDPDRVKLPEVPLSLLQKYGPIKITNMRGRWIDIQLGPNKYKDVLSFPDGEDRFRAKIEVEGKEYRIQFTKQDVR